MFKDRERDYVPRPDQTGVFCREGRRAQDRSWAITFLIGEYIFVLFILSEIGTRRSRGLFLNRFEWRDFYP